MEDVVPNLVTDQTNNLLTMFPSEMEIHGVVFNLRRDSIASPDGFGPILFQTFWSMIKEDVISATLQFFTEGWVSPSYNSNTLVLLPEVKEADKIEKYRPIALANFKFKIISKILADILAKVLPQIISKEHKGFIRGRSIRDCVSLTSEVANLLHKKIIGGNIMLNLDIAKAIDTLIWNFILKVLHQFSFYEKFFWWNHSILNLANISVSSNGQFHGFFKCQRGVRQGDPLSPLLFCIVENVLSRDITKLVLNNNVKLLKASKNVTVPSHTIYTNDIILITRGCTSSLESITSLFSFYAECSS